MTDPDKKPEESTDHNQAATPPPAPSVDPGAAPPPREPETPPPPPEPEPTAPPPASPAPENPPAPGELAGVGPRVLAVLIDSLIVGALSMIRMGGIGYLLGLAYFVTRDALPFLEGQSVGKKAMKLRAVNAETGERLTNDWGPSVIRNIVLYIPFFAIVELIVLINNDQNQRLGDQWAKTKVVVDPS